MRRRLAVFGLLALVAASGCVTPFSTGQLSEERLSEPAAYDWNTSAAATIELTTNDTYRAVYTVDGDTFAVYRTDGLNRDRSVRVRSVRYRYPNGSTITIPAANTTVSQERTTISVPNGTGQLAYVAESRAKRFSTPVLVNGSHTIVLPPGRDVSNPVFGAVRPNADRVTRNGQVRLHWERVERDSITVRYYRTRDVGLFLGLAVLAGLLAALAVGYVYLQIRRLRRRREELGLDVDIDDSGDDPPPGLR
jgi:hypothetical protein